MEKEKLYLDDMVILKQRTPKNTNKYLIKNNNKCTRKDNIIRYVEFLSHKYLNTRPFGIMKQQRARKDVGNQTGLKDS
jgi:hypothetical protein